MALMTMLLVSLSSACESTEPTDTTFTFDLNRGPQGFVAGFADYPTARSPDHDLVSEWELKSFEAQSIPSPVSVSSDGRAWILFGTDSGYEGRTGIYFTRLSVGFTPK